MGIVQDWLKVSYTNNERPDQCALSLITPISNQVGEPERMEVLGCNLACSLFCLIVMSHARQKLSLGNMPAYLPTLIRAGPVRLS